MAAIDGHNGADAMAKAHQLQQRQEHCKAVHLPL
jgi:NAD(P)H-hydrate repair Nnr-like enzyme with NAD(P)H-hydrate epimerase domain